MKRNKNPINFALFLCGFLLIGSTAFAEDGSLSSAPDPTTTTTENESAEEETPNEANEDQAQEAEAEPEEEIDPDSEWFIDFYADQFYRYRFGDDEETDSDVSAFGHLSGTCPKDRFAFDLSGGLWWDVDGIEDGDERTGAEFLSMRDDQPLWGELYQASVEYHSPGPVALARVGRQAAEVGAPVIFDGAHLAFSMPIVDIYIFGGRTFHFFEIDQGPIEDWIASVGMRISPIRNLRFDIDYRFAIEEIYPNEDQVTDHMFGIKGWYRYEDWLYLNAEVRSINEDVYEAGGSILFESEEKGVSISAEVNAQPSTIDEISEREDPYYNILGESLPHLKYSASISKSLNADWVKLLLTIGYNGNSLLYGRPETAFNRNFGQSYLLISADDLGIHGLFASLSFERWESVDSDSQGNYQWALGGAVGYRSEIIEAKIGTDYAAYKYDYYQVADERVDVQTIFADLVITPIEYFSIKAQYELELYEDKFGHVIKAGLSEQF